MFLSQQVGGCNQNTCQFNPGWACRQPGANNSGLADVPGPIRIPGPDGLLPATQGWGEVPYAFNITCWCTAPLGSYASVDTNCFATPCPFPTRCVLQNPSLPSNGTTCVTGSQGVGCATCSKQWYRYLDSCRPCPKGINPAVVVLGVFLCVGLLYVGPKLAQLSSPQAVALLRSLVMYCQYLSISFDIHLRWPAGLLAFFAWLKALTNGIQLAAPECLSANWSYYLYVRLLLIAVAVLFTSAFAFAEFQRFLKFLIRDARNLDYLEKLNMRRNGMKQFAAFGTAIAYVYTCGVLLQAWNCVSNGSGSSVLRSDPKIFCDTAKHHALRQWAAVCIVVVGAGVPLLCIAWVKYLQRSAHSTRFSVAMMRPYWRGLGDPSTRYGWGGFYEMYRFAAPPPGTKLFTARGACPLTSDELAHISSAVQLRLRLLDRLDAVRLHVSLRVAPVFEAFIYIQKLLLLVALNLASSTGLLAASHAIIYAGMACAVALIWPCRRLNVFVPALFWVPHVPAKYQPSTEAMQAARKASRLFPKGFQRHPKRGWVWRGHVLINDVLNIALLFANVVPFLNVVLVLIPSKAGTGVLQTFLIGLNCINIIITLGSWLFSIATWRFQAMELLRVKSGKKPSGASGSIDATGYVPPVDEHGSLEPVVDGYDGATVYVATLPGAAAPAAPTPGEESITAAMPPPPPSSSPLLPALQPAAVSPSDPLGELVPTVDGYIATQPAGHYPDVVLGPAVPGGAEAGPAAAVEDEGAEGDASDDDVENMAKPPPLTSDFDRAMLREYGLEEDDIVEDAGLTVSADKGYLKAMLAVMSGMAKASLTVERDPEEVLQTIRAAGLRYKVLVDKHMRNDAEAIVETTEVLVKATLARLEERRLFLEQRGGHPAQEAELRALIRKLEDAFHQAGFERSHYVDPGAKSARRWRRALRQAKKLDEEAEAAGKQRHVLKGRDLLLVALILLVIISVGVGLALQALFQPAPPLPPVPPVYIASPLVTLSNVSLTALPTATALTAALATLPGGLGQQLGSAYVSDVPVTGTLVLSGTASLSSAGFFTLQDTIKSLTDPLVAALNVSTSAYTITATLLLPPSPPAPPPQPPSPPLRPPPPPSPLPGGVATAAVAQPTSATVTVTTTAAAAAVPASGVCGWGAAAGEHHVERPVHPQQRREHQLRVDADHPGRHYGALQSGLLLPAGFRRQPADFGDAVSGRLVRATARQHRLRRLHLVLLCQLEQRGDAVRDVHQPAQPRHLRPRRGQLCGHSLQRHQRPAPTAAGPILFQQLRHAGHPVVCVHQRVAPAGEGCHPEFGADQLDCGLLPLVQQQHRRLPEPEQCGKLFLSRREWQQRARHHVWHRCHRGQLQRARALRSRLRVRLLRGQHHQ